MTKKEVTHNGVKPKHKRSRFGCRECKRLKMKCDETKPLCSSCERKGKICDYSMTLTWGGRPYKKPKEEVMVKVPKEMLLNDLNSGIEQPKLLKQSIKADEKAPKFSTNGSIFLDDLGETINRYSKTLDDQPLDESQTLMSSVSDHKRKYVENSVGQEKSRKTKDYMSKYLAESLAPGILSLTDALGSIAGDKSSYMHLENMNLLNDLAFLPTTNDTTSSTESPSNLINQDNLTVKESSQLDNLFLEFDTYQEDLMKIDKAFDKEPKGLLVDPFLTRAVLRKLPPVVDLSDLDEDEDEDEEINQYNKQVKLMRDDFEITSSSSSSSVSLNIPRGLVPLPDLLLNVPYYLESFHFFRDVTSGTLVPAPAHAYKENPFRVILPRLAMTNESILSILIAFGITHKSFMLGQPEPKEVLDQLLSRCLKELILLLEDKEDCKSDLTLALVMMIGSFDMFSLIQNNWKLHLQGAKQILIKRGLKNPFNKQLLESSSKKYSSIGKLPLTVSSIPKLYSKETSVSQFLVGWFNYIDVLSSLATSLKPCNSKITDLHWKKYDSGNSTVYYSLDEDVEIDMFLGFDVRFLQIATEMISLIKRTNVFLSEETSKNDVVLPNELMIEAVEMRENLGQVFQSSNEKYFGVNDEALLVLRSTNELFYLSLLIHLYRRVFLVPRETTVIKSLCLKIGRILKDRIEVGSNLEICSSFVIFTAGLEVTDEESRKFFKKKLANQYNIGNYVCKNLSKVLQLSWDLEKDWTEIIDQYKIDLTFV